MIEYARGAGLAGLLDMIVDGITSSSITFAVRVYGWESNLAWPVVDRSGRLGRPRIRLEDQKGDVEFLGEAQIAAYPLPASGQYNTGTLTLTQNSTNYISFPVRISQVTFTKKGTRTDPGSDIWQITGKAVKNGNTSITWNGTQVTCTAATINYAELDSGLAKLYDPQSIQLSANQVIDVEAMPDNDTGESATIASYTATASAPMAGLKVIGANFRRTGSGGGPLNIRWGNIDSADRYELPATQTFTDASSLGSSATIGVVATSSSTATLTGFAYRGSSVRQLTNGTVASLNQYVTVSRLGLRSTAEDITFPGTYAMADSQSIQHTGRVTVVSNNSAPSLTIPGGFPAGLKQVAFNTRQLTSSLGTNNQYATTWNLGLNDSKDRVELPGTATYSDNSSLSSRATIAKVNATTSTLTGFSLRGTTVRQLTNQADSANKYVTTTEFGLRNKAEDITLPGTYVLLDPNSTQTAGRVTVVSNNSSPTLSLPAGFPSTLKEVRKQTIQLTSALGTDNQYATTWSLSLRDTEDGILFPRTAEVRSTSAPWIGRRPYLLNSTTNVVDLATNLMGTYQTTSYFDRLSLTPTSDGQRVVLLEYKNIGNPVNFETSDGSRYAEYQMSGTNPQLYVVSNIDAGSGRRLIEFGRVRVHSKPIRKFVVLCQYQGTTIADTYPATLNGQTLPNIGEINSASFMGIAAKKVCYMGATGRVNIGLASTASRMIYTGYRFYSDPLGIAENVPQKFFTKAQLLTTSATSTGWTNVSTLGLTDIVEASTGSFSAFTTAFTP